MAKEVILLLPVQSTDRVLCSIVCFVKCLSSPKNQLEKIDVRPEVVWMGAAHQKMLLLRNAFFRYKKAPAKM